MTLREAQLFLRVTEDVLARIRRQAEIRGVKPNDLVRFIIGEKLTAMENEQKAKEAKNAGRERDPAGDGGGEAKAG